MKKQLFLILLLSVISIIFGIKDNYAQIAETLHVPDSGYVQILKSNDGSTLYSQITAIYDEENVSFFQAAGLIYRQNNDSEINKADKNETVTKKWSNIGGLGSSSTINFLISYQFERPIKFCTKKFHPHFSIGFQFDDFSHLYNSTPGLFGLFELYPPAILGKSVYVFGGTGLGQFRYREHWNGYNYITKTVYIISGGMQINLNNSALIQPRLYLSPQNKEPLIFTMNIGFKTKSTLKGILTLPLAWIGFHTFFFLIGAE